MLTYQDFEKVKDNEQQLQVFLQQAISQHRASDMFQTAETADLYDAQRNKTINEYVQKIFSINGAPLQNFTASNAKIASNFFNHLNTQRNTYLLGNGVSFTDHVEKILNEDGEQISIDTTKELLGDAFDSTLMQAGYYALIHGLSFVFENNAGRYVFKLTEFVPLWDEETAELRAGIRFRQLDETKPLYVDLYTEDGVTKYQQVKKADKWVLIQTQSKSAYLTVVSKAPADAEAEIISQQNYDSFPIVPFWGSRLHQSTLIGMQSAIDSFDLIRSGFANDLTDCSQIYWLLENYGGMDPQSLSRFRDQLLTLHIANVDSTDGGKVTPYTQEIPYQARKEYLESIRAGIYEDFGALDVHTVAAGATNDHIDAAYQPMDERADDYEYQCTAFIKRILRLHGIDDNPVYKRNRVSNQKEMVEMIVLEAGLGVLDDETILQKLPNITPDEVQHILSRKDAEDENRFEPEEEVVV